MLLPTIASNGESNSNNVCAGLWRQSSDMNVDSDANVVMLDRWPAMWLEAAAVAATMETTATVTATERQRLLRRRRLSYRMSVEKRRTVDASSQNKNANELNEKEGIIDEAITFEVGTKLLLLLVIVGHISCRKMWWRRRRRRWRTREERETDTHPYYALISEVGGKSEIWKCLLKCNEQQQQHIA